MLPNALVCEARNELHHTNCYKEFIMDNLKGTVKIVITRIKELQKQLEIEKQEERDLGRFDDCGEFYRTNVQKTEARISELINIKIKLERYRKSCNSL